MAPDTFALGRLYAPIGMDLGAEAPSEIALSIAAEILAVLRRRSGGHLHVRGGSIHGETPANAAERRELVAAISAMARFTCQTAGA